MHEVQIGPALRGYAAVLEEDRLLESEEHLFAKVGGLVAELEGGEAASLARDHVPPLPARAQHPARALAERLVRRLAAKALQLGLHGERAPGGSEAVE